MLRARQIHSILAAAALLSPLSPLAAQDQGKPTQDQSTPVASPGGTIRVSTELVLVNVVARDKKGNPIRDLKKEDFTLYEDGKKQDISSFDFEDVDQVQNAGGLTVTGSAPGTTPGTLLHSSKKAPPTLDARDRRLILLFFDFSAMEPEQVDRSVDAAKKFVQTKMQPADLIAMVSLATNMHVDCDFTDDQKKLLAILDSYNSGEGQGFDTGTTGSAEGAAETGGSFTEDDTDLNTFTADRKLLAIQSLMDALNKLPQKKSVIYFSNGITQSGVDNQSALRAATAAAVKANASIYSLDVRGLQAFPPGGEAQNASLHGQSAYTGASILNDLNGNAASQDTLATLSSDTGGKAFFDSNDFAPAFQRMQQDMSAYYVIGFRSADARRDGSYRRLSIKINRSDVKLEYRPGYYAPADYKHSNKEDRERQLDDQLASDLPATDVSVYLQALYFRVDDFHYSVPISILVPGSQIPFVKGGDRDKATLDVIGEVKDSAGRVIGNARDTVKLAIDQAQQVRQRNIQYSTSFTLPAGKFHLKFVVRENETGRMGSFETDINVPDLRKAPVKLSSVVLASQRVPAGKKTDNPLIREGQQIIPNLPHVFRQDQHLYFLYEIYNPAKATATVTEQPAADNGAAKKSKNSKDTATTPVRVFTSIEFLSNGLKVYETPLVQATQLNVPTRDAIAFQFDVPLTDLKPGLYTCQVNVIDDAGGSFSFPRMALLIREGAPATPTPATTTGTSPSGR
jgi:VWFA-related protein